MGSLAEALTCFVMASIWAVMQPCFCLFNSTFCMRSYSFSGFAPWWASSPPLVSLVVKTGIKTSRTLSWILLDLEIELEVDFAAR